MKVEITEQTGTGADKVKRYGWVIDDKPGQMLMLHKNDLQVHPAYQRDQIPSKIIELTSAWSWVGAGALIVGHRGNEYWVIDGQHRLLAAKRRSDITHLPCVVFETSGIRQEAKAFLAANAGRKPVTAIGKYKALIASGDTAAIVVHKTLEALSITVKPHAQYQNEIKAIAWALRKANENPDKFETVMMVAAELCVDMPVQERLLDGLWYIDQFLPCGITDKKLSERMKKIGARKLIEAANRASSYFARGGAKIWATGMIEEINKGLKTKYEFVEAVNK